MSNLILHELPRLRQPALLVAFRGWPDAGEVASGALRFLRRSLAARKFAEFDTQPFYDFTQARPVSRVVGPGVRGLSWPSCDFSWARGSGERDLVLFVAQEPQLQWRAFTAAMMELTEAVGLQVLVSLGGTYDSVAHTQPPVVSGHATEGALRERLQRLGVGFSDYEGPSSIHSALMEAAYQRRLTAVGLWGHAPHYVTNVPNPKVSHGLLAKAAQLLGFDWELGELERAGEEFTRQVDRALEGRPELQDYVRRLERSARSEPPEGERSGESGPAELPPPEAVVRHLEDYLRGLRQGGQAAE